MEALADVQHTWVGGDAVRQAVCVALWCVGTKAPVRLLLMPNTPHQRWSLMFLLQCLQGTSFVFLLQVICAAKPDIYPRSTYTTASKDLLAFVLSVSGLQHAHLQHSHAAFNEWLWCWMTLSVSMLISLHQCRQVGWGLQDHRWMDDGKQANRANSKGVNVPLPESSD